jgi:transcriptional regulator with XRE-family HTH domain
MSVLAKRLKEARLRAGLSQERLGIEAGLDPMSASKKQRAKIIATIDELF